MSGVCLSCGHCLQISQKSPLMSRHNRKRERVDIREVYSCDQQNSSQFFHDFKAIFEPRVNTYLLWVDWTWSVVSKVIMDSRISQYLAVLLKKTSKLCERVDEFC